MAQEWYLMDTDHDMVSGFESDGFTHFAADAFQEALSSDIGTDVEICNYDLSQRNSIRVIIQGNLQETKLNSLTRRMLSPIGTCEAGQYVYYKNRYWLIVGLVDDNGIYEKSILVLCNYLLTWKNPNGEIIQRWVSASSASQYNNGETSDKFMFMRSDQLMVLTPCDDECLLIRHKQRFIMDMRCKIYEKHFSPDITIDTSNPVITYELTRMDNVLYNYQDSGHSEFMAYQDEQHENDGYYVINGNGYWLCEEPDSPVALQPPLSCHIECNEPIIYNGIDPTVFIACFTDIDGNKENITPQWEIDCDFIDNLFVEKSGDSIYISANDKKLINKSFELSLFANGYEKTTMTVQIKAFM